MSLNWTFWLFSILHHNGLQYEITYLVKNLTLFKHHTKSSKRPWSTFKMTLILRSEKVQKFFLLLMFRVMLQKNYSLQDLYIFIMVYRHLEQKYAGYGKIMYGQIKAVCPKKAIFQPSAFLMTSSNMPIKIEWMKNHHIQQYSYLTDRYAMYKTKLEVLGPYYVSAVSIWRPFFLVVILRLV